MSTPSDSNPGTAPAAAHASWSVLKFGGTSVSARERWDTIGRLVAQRSAESGPVLVVVSALSGVTNELQAIVDCESSRSRCADAVDALIKRHHEFAGVLGLVAGDVLGSRLDALRRLCADPRRAASALDWQAELMAQGELLSSTLGAAYLRQGGLAIDWIDARQWLRAASQPNQSAWAARLSANCELRTDAAWRDGFAAQGSLLITQGFIAGAVDGSTVLLGRGGSDTSAACFGALLRAERVEIWTDVPGMFSANPRQVPQARLLTRLDYEEAQEIATTGAKVLHPRCIGPCRDARVPLWIRDTERPELPGTLIDAHRADAPPGVKAISSRRGIVLVSMESIGMWQQVGFLADVFERFRVHGLSVDLIGSAESNVTVSLDPSENLVNSNVLEALCADLAKVCRVRAIAPCAAITLVGRGMRSLLHRLSDVLAEFGRERVHLISQSSNDLNLTFVVDEDLAEGLLPRLHDLLIGSGAMPVDQTEVFGPSWRQICQAQAPARERWWRARRARLLALAAGGPRYVYHLPTAREQARRLLELPAIDRAHYALKANPLPALLRTLDAEGMAFECVSGGELEHLFAVLPTLDPQRVLFTPSFAPRVEYEAALRRGVRVTLDSCYPLQHWPELFRGRNLMLRIDPGFGSGHHEKVRTGGKGAKFGLPEAAVGDFVALARGLDIRIDGLHAHIGSGIFEPGHWRQVYAQLVALAEQIGSVEAIDVGGGLGVPYEPEADAFDIAAYGAALADLRRAYPQYRLWVEPGRFVSAAAGALLLRVTQVIQKQDVRRIGVDGGMNALMRPALYGAWHEIVNLSRPDDAPGAPADVVGPICETGDVLGRRRRLPATTAEGDVLLVADTGAYGAVMANTYNLRPLPGEDVLDD